VRACSPLCARLLFAPHRQTGKLLDVLPGHKGPVACLAFDGVSGVLASGSWDKTVKLWNVWKSECVETLEHPADVLCLAWRPDGKQLCTGELGSACR